MGHSPLLGTDPVPSEPAGRDSGSLGPSDTSDSGSDLVGVGDGGGAGLPLAETLQEAEQPDVPADIDADRIVTPHREVGAAPPEPRRPNPEPDAPAPTEPTPPDAPPAEPEDSEERKPGRTAALLRPRL